MLADDSESLSLSADSEDESLEEDEAEEELSELKPVGQSKSTDLAILATSGRNVWGMKEGLHSQNLHCVTTLCTC